ncbi:MAG: tail fiber protein [Pseudomonadota bacterium]
MFTTAFKRGALPLLACLTMTITAMPNKVAADSEPFLGEMKIVGYNFCPRGWAEANGQLLPIAQNQALFSILGTIYGGDGRTTFALPDLRGRVVLSRGAGPGLSSFFQSAKAGSETANMAANNMPAHNHRVNANNKNGDKGGPKGKLLAAAPPGGTGNETIYNSEPADARRMNPSMISSTGQSASFDVTDPGLGILHCIALQGIFPSRS